MKNVRKAVLMGVIAAAVMTAGASAFAAQVDFFLTIDGVKQGRFKGDSTDKRHAGEIMGLAFDYDVQSPRDAATGQPTGRRIHKPLVITKRIDAASPQIYQALATNEVLRSVQLDFVRTTAEGVEETLYTIKL